MAKLVVLTTLCLLVLAIPIAATPNVTFVDPTPPDDNLTRNNYAYINVSVADDNPGGAFVDWNRSLAGYWSMEWYNGTGVFDNSSWANNGTFAGTRLLLLPASSVAA